MRKLPSAVILLGTVSLLNDMASDMIMPLLPVFLTATLGAGPAILSLIEGVAESTASLLKLWAGRLGDGGVGHKPLAVTGYALSNLVRPLLSVAGSWGVVMAVRFADRAGKGLRTSPRDALVSGSVNADQRGQAFGLHRAMDHTDAFIGPLLASGLLAYGLTMQQVFLASVVPGVLAVALLVFGLRVAHAAERRVTPPPLQWSLLHPRLRAMVITAGSLALVAVPMVGSAGRYSVLDSHPVGLCPCRARPGRLTHRALVGPSWARSCGVGRLERAYTVADRPTLRQSSGGCGHYVFSLRRLDCRYGRRGARGHWRFRRERDSKDCVWTL